MMQLDAGLLQALDYFQPLSPIWIDQKVAFMCLKQKRGVSDPGDAKLPWFDSGESRNDALAGTPGEKRWNQHLGKKIPPMPGQPRTQANAR